MAFPPGLPSDYRSFALREIARCCMPRGTARVPAKTATLDGKKQRRAPPAARGRGTERRTSKRRRALIIGGSMSGLLAALMLQRRGWDVDVFERVETELAGRGAGILAQAELIAHVGALGLEGARPRRGAQRPQARCRGRGIGCDSPTGCARPCASFACPLSRRSTPVMWPGARSCRRASCRRQSTATSLPP